MLSLSTDLPHSAEYDSVEEDLITRASQNHPLSRDDNAQVYFELEKALRRTSYLASIKPFQRGRNGRDTFFAIHNQYAGEDKGHTELKKQEYIVHNRVLKGQGQFTLDRFVAQHRNAFIMMKEFAHHVPYQVPKVFTRVTHLLDYTQCRNASLQAAMELFRNNKGTVLNPGKANHFENAVAFILPYDPVARYKSANKREVNASATAVKPPKKQKNRCYHFERITEIIYRQNRG